MWRKAGAGALKAQLLLKKKKLKLFVCGLVV